MPNAIQMRLIKVLQFDVYILNMDLYHLMYYHLGEFLLVLHYSLMSIVYCMNVLVYIYTVLMDYYYGEMMNLMAILMAEILLCVVVKMKTHDVNINL